jgi:lysozyme
MINQESLDLIKDFEGFRAEAYPDSVGIWTIGYGTTAAAGVGIDPHAGMAITKSEAEWYLQKR